MNVLLSRSKRSMKGKIKLLYDIYNGTAIIDSKATFMVVNGGNEDRELLVCNDVVLIYICCC